MNFTFRTGNDEVVVNVAATGDEVAAARQALTAAIEALATFNPPTQHFATETQLVNDTLYVNIGGQMVDVKTLPQYSIGGVTASPEVPVIARLPEIYPVKNNIS